MPEPKGYGLVPFVFVRKGLKSTALVPQSDVKGEHGHSWQPRMRMIRQTLTWKREVGTHARPDD